MPLTAEGVWVVEAGAVVLEQIRERLEAELGRPVTFDATPEGAIADVVAQLRVEQDQRASALVAAASLDEATDSALDRLAREADLERRQATRSRYTVRSVTDAAPLSIPAGVEVRGGGADGRARWLTVGGEVIEADETPGDPIVIEAIEAGPVAIDGSPTLDIITPIEGLVSVARDGADAAAVGSPQERDPQLRARIRRQRVRAGAGPYDAIRGALLAIPWVVAVSVVRGATGGVIAITVVPAPIGADRIEQLGEVIVASIPAGADTQGAAEITVTLPGGETDVVRYEAGGTVPVAVTFTATFPASIGQTAGEAAATAAIEALGAELDVGQPLRILDMLVAIQGAGALTASIGSPSADVVPDPTDLIVLTSVGPA